jgi:limonene-1,2-epoxide hydrolase
MSSDTSRRAFLGAAGLSAGALLGVANSAAAADLSPAEQANVKIVRDFCAAWSTRDMAKILPFLGDDCVYRMSETTPPVTGHDGVRERLGTWVKDSSLIEFRILDSMAAGPIVINHRVDRFLTAQPLTWEGVGVFFVKDGKIKEWSDYTIRVQR